jgi:hypothetical protein
VGHVRSRAEAGKMRGCFSTTCAGGFTAEASTSQKQCAQRHGDIVRAPKSGSVHPSLPPNISTASNASCSCGGCA